MGESHPTGCCGVTRRGFLLGTAAGAAGGAALTWLGLRGIGRPTPLVKAAATPPPRPIAPTKLGMPGPFPGRVVEVRRPDAVYPDHRINQEAVDAMIDRGMKELVNADHPQEAWRELFSPDDVVGIKVNPVGRKPKPGEGGRVANAVGVISSPEVILKIVADLKEAGVKPKNIILFERYADEFINTGYEDLMRERVLDGVRWYASAAHYTGSQLDIRGFDHGRDSVSVETAKHVVGYDPDVFVHMGFASPDHDRQDDRRFRSHLSLIVTRMISKLITIPNLKDHRSAGVTLALKNMSHGMNNNVARSHISGVVRLDGGESGPNQCNTFIPTAAGQHPLREKATLHLMDGLIGVYEGGPGSWNLSWGTWHRQSLFFATDPVAMDHVGWQIIDAQRALVGLPSVAHMGLLQESNQTRVARALAPLAAADPATAMMLAGPAKDVQDSRRTEAFDVRQPQHVILAGDQHGLGIFDRSRIEHRRIMLKG